MPKHKNATMVYVTIKMSAHRNVTTKPKNVPMADVLISTIVIRHVKMDRFAYRAVAKRRIQRCVAVSRARIKRPTATTPVTGKPVIPVMAATWAIVFRGLHRNVRIGHAMPITQSAATAVSGFRAARWKPVQKVFARFRPILPVNRASAAMTANTAAQRMALMKHVRQA
jgi:hypothetical protein